MRGRFEFSFYRIAAADVAGGVDPTLALMGGQGWELRALVNSGEGDILVGLQRPLGEDLPLPDAPTLAASLNEPLTAPTSGEI